MSDVAMYVHHLAIVERTVLKAKTKFLSMLLKKNITSKHQKHVFANGFAQCLPNILKATRELATMKKIKDADFQHVKKYKFKYEGDVPFQIKVFAGKVFSFIRGKF